jgi:hypothetical protein
MDLKVTILEFNDCSAISILDVSNWQSVSWNPLTLAEYEKLTDDSKTDYLSFYSLGSTPPSTWKQKTMFANIKYTSTTSSDVEKKSVNLLKEGPFSGTKGTDWQEFLYSAAGSNEKFKLRKPTPQNGGMVTYIYADKTFGIDLIEDGIYNIVYESEGIQFDGSEPTAVQVMVFISGQVRNKVYKSLASLPIATNNIDLKENNFTEILYAYTLLRACENANYVAQIDDLINGLKTLEKFCLTTKCFKHHIDD